MARARTKGQSRSLEQTLWDAADKLRGNLEAAEYKHVVLGLVFLKYVSDSFEKRREFLVQASADESNNNYYLENEEARERLVENRDEYISESVFWVPPDARWDSLQAQAKQRDIGRLIDHAMDVIEKENASLKGVLPKTYARSEIDTRLLGELVDLVGSIGFKDTDHGSDDVLGRVYEYFLGRFASAEGRNAGEFYTPRCVVRLLVEMLEPYSGRVYDPCCGSGGMFVQSAEFVAAHGGARHDISIYGQEFVAATWRLAKMNLALRNIEASLADEAADSFHSDKYPDLRADYILANPPFNKDDWWSPALQDDPRWRFGVPPESNANFAWVQHFVHHLSPNGTAGFVLANGSLSSGQLGEGDIRRALIHAGLVDCIVALPSKLFFNTPIPVSLWFISKSRTGRTGLRDRRNELLFIDGRSLGHLVSRRLRELGEDDIGKVSNAYHLWRGSKPGSYEDLPGFSYAASVQEVEMHNFNLSPGRYVGTGEDDELADASATLEELAAQLAVELEESDSLNSELRALLARVRNV